MKSRTRYGLIAFGIFVFIISAPLLIFYISGTTFNFSDRGTSSTGILDAKSNPTGAKLLIDGKENSSTPAIARFLKQGEYAITLTKTGYYDWSKRLPIESGQVTYAQLGVDQVQLIKNTEPLIVVPGGVTSFLLINDTVWYAQGNNIIYFPVNNPNQKTVFNNVAHSPLAITQLRDKKHLLITGAKESIIVDTDAKTLLTLPFQLSGNSQLQMASDDVAMYLKGGKIHSYNFTTKNSEQLRIGIRSFTMLDNTIYFVNNNGSISSAIWNGTDFTDEQIIISNANLSSDEIKLLITDRKELFLLNGKVGLFRVGQNLDLVLSSVESVNLSLDTNELSIVSAGELWFYNFLTSAPQLLTRGTIATHTFSIHSSIGYGFSGNDDGLEAIEIDTRDQQNRYPLLKGGAVWQLALTNDQKTIVALQDGLLVQLEIRN